MNYYFHIPFCRRRCAYCAFYSMPHPETSHFDAYLDRLAKELEISENPPAETVYLGGGTPTLLDVPHLEKLFSLILRHIPLKKDCEISIEANPETLDAQKVALIRGFATRISVGVQSFSAVKRKTLGRICSGAALENALSLVAEAKFPHFNCDLIYGVPGETPEMWAKEFDFLAELPIDHLSCYALTPEEGSSLGGDYAVDDGLADILWEKTALLAREKLGMARYEISNYAKKNGECRHNVNVWRGQLLRGYGPSASGFDGVDRMTHPADFAAWLAGVPAEIDRISPRRRLNEIFAVNLRTAKGWTREMWESVPHADAWNLRQNRARDLQNRLSGVILITEQRIALTRKGLRFWNSVAEEILE